MITIVLQMLALFVAVLLIIQQASCLPEPQPAKNQGSQHGGYKPPHYGGYKPPHHGGHKPPHHG